MPTSMPSPALTARGVELAESHGSVAEMDALCSGMRRKPHGRVRWQERTEGEVPTRASSLRRGESMRKPQWVRATDVPVKMTEMAGGSRDRSREDQDPTGLIQDSDLHTALCCVFI